MKKDIEWIKEKVHKRIDKLPRTYSGLYIDGSRDAYLLALKDINQLDEPEVLSHELPVIPKFVAEWIESRKNNYPSDVIGAYLRMNETSANEQTRRVLSWIHETELNRGSFARAWLNGFTVEEEPLYKARLKVITDEFIASYLRTQSSDAEDRLKALEIGSKYIHEDYRHLSEFTEDELKRLNIWDSEQWEVEELEENDKD